MEKSLHQLKIVLWLAQLGFFSFLIICAIKEPMVVVLNNGISNFGRFSNSVIPYSLIFISYGLLLMLVNHILNRHFLPRRHLNYTLWLLATFQFLILLTTFYNFKLPLGDLHNYVGEAAFLTAYQLSIYLVIKSWRSVNCVLLSLQTIGFLIALLSTFRVIHFLFFAQVLTALAAGVLLNSQLPKLVEQTEVVE